ncbi:MAG: hypothetical protein PHP97_01510 [Candidatus Shapirobacteria bacterium]|nr:hypothetical protein [Candidatus Shapirobacteria bacterium]MDD3002861.1 hypothetical protein [Candidatus Shapirobacteria bacterium]MDD4382935.1 hypothetical protein [Candidatus Shapirobacteria bacterium]
MFLTNLDAVIISLFLGSGIILTTLFGILLSFQFKYKELKILLSMFFSLTIFSIISLLAYGFIILFRWPGMIDVSIFATINILVIWLYVRLFSVFRQFVRLMAISIAIGLIIVNFIVFIIQVITGNNLLMLLAGFLSLLTVIDLHFLTLTVLIKFQNEPEYE